MQRTIGAAALAAALALPSTAAFAQTSALHLIIGGEAYDGPPTDPKVFEENQKKLQEELQKKAEEARQKLQQQQQGKTQ